MHILYSKKNTKGRARGIHWAKTLQPGNYCEFYTNDDEISELIARFPKIHFKHIKTKSPEISPTDRIIHEFPQLWSMEYYDYVMLMKKRNKIIEKKMRHKPRCMFDCRCTDCYYWKSRYNNKEKDEKLIKYLIEEDFFFI